MDPSVMPERAHDFCDFMESASTKDNGYRSFEDEHHKPAVASDHSLGHSSSGIQHSISTKASPCGDKPRNWSEVYALQEALAPTARTFARVTGRQPPSTSPWDSYDDQVVTLQQMSDRLWRRERRMGEPPKLARLESWAGGIREITTAAILLSEEMVEGSEHPSLLHNQCNHSQHEAQMGQQRYDMMEAELQNGETRARNRENRAGSTISGSLSKGGDAVRNQREAFRSHLDAVVARDLDKYKKWLEFRAFAFYAQQHPSVVGVSWDNWCLWFAPTAFESVYPLKAILPPYTPGAVKMGGSVPSSPRPIVSMAEAMRGHLAWKAARDGAAHAQRAKAVSHGMRDDGQDVRLCNIADQMKAAFEESNMRSSGSHDLVHHAGRQ